MPMIEWTRRISIGVAELDEEHKVLVRLVNELFDAARIGEAGPATARALDGLLDYASTHFEHEERLMREMGYADLESHAAEHRELTRKARAMRASFSGEASAADSTAAIGLMINWLDTHIKGVDTPLGEYLNAKGVR